MAEENKKVDLVEDEKPKIKLKYKISLDDIYEYLKEDANQNGTVQVKKYQNKFAFYAALCMLASIAIFLIPGFEKEIAVVPIIAIGFFYVNYRANVGTVKNSDKMLGKLQAKAKKRGGNSFTEGQDVAFYDEYIICLHDGYSWQVDYEYLAGTYYTENLLVIRIFDGKKIPCADVERIIIPKRIMSEQNLKQIEDFVQNKLKEIYGDKYPLTEYPDNK